MVKAVDDAFLGMTAPAIGLMLALCHGLPRATNRVHFEKVGIADPLFMRVYPSSLSQLVDLAIGAWTAR